MVSKGVIPALLVVGGLGLISPAAVVAAEPWVEVRQALRDDCNQYRGHMGAICTRSASDKMRTYYEESRALYQSCIEAGNSRSYCDEERENYWQSKLVF